MIIILHIFMFILYTNSSIRGAIWMQNTPYKVFKVNWSNSFLPFSFLLSFLPSSLPPSLGTFTAELTAWETSAYWLLTFFLYIHWYHNLRSMCLKAANEEVRKPPGPAWKNKDESKQPEEHRHQGVNTQLERVIKSELIQIFSRAGGL